ncbi:MAG TPA: hypothetical protein VGD91_21125 [Trebonia sp.]
MNPAELAGAEKLLWQAFPRGGQVDLSGAPAGPARVIRAEVISALLLGALAAEPGSGAGIALRGATVTGPLELGGGTVAHPVAAAGCRFDTAISLVDSTVRTVRILDSELPGLDATRLRLDGILDLTGSQVTGCVRLEEAKISGQLRMRSARTGTGTGTDAVAATGLSVDGDVDCSHLEARGEVSFRSARIAGVLDLAGARISAPGGRGLVLSYAAVGGKLECRDLEVDGETRAVNCRVAASLIMSGARLANPPGLALSAGGLDVGGGAFFDRGFRASGAFWLIGARFADNLTLEDSTFGNPGGTAVNLVRAVIGEVRGNRLTCHGEWSMTGARVGGDVSLARAVLEAGAGACAFNAERARIEGTLFLQEAKTLGALDLRSITVGERLRLQRAELRNPGHTACRLSRAQITSDVFCDEMTADGGLRLGGAVIGGALTLLQVRLASTSGPAVDAGNLQVRELILKPAVMIDGEVDLRHATVGLLRDDPATWPARLRLDGLTYQVLEPLLPAGRRLQWLARDANGYQPQPYEQLAAHYSALGQAAQGRNVLYARERLQRRGKGPVVRAWSALQDVTVGYGYRPRRALGWLAVLLAIGSVVFSVAPPAALQAGAAPHFNGMVYTLDLLVPVVNLGQKYAFNPGGAEQWLSYLLIVAGWTLATTVAAGAARVLQRG